MTSTRRIASVASTLVVIATSRVGAQQSDPVTGMTIRYRLIAARDFPAATSWTQGRVARVAPDTVFLQACSRCRERALAPLADYDIERHSGTGSRGNNAKVGALAGAGAGVGAVLYSLSECKPSDDLCGIRIVFAPVAAAGGALVGALLGAIVVPGQWTPWRPNE